VHAGRAWDHVFDVELDSGAKLKLAMDTHENPYLVADRFGGLGGWQDGRGGGKGLAPLPGGGQVGGLGGWQDGRGGGKAIVPLPGGGQVGGRGASRGWGGRRRWDGGGTREPACMADKRAEGVHENTYLGGRREGKGGDQTGLAGPGSAGPMRRAGGRFNVHHGGVSAGPFRQPSSLRRPLPPLQPQKGSWLSMSCQGSLRSR
jgi:hypothetical protein